MGAHSRDPDEGITDDAWIGTTPPDPMPTAELTKPVVEAKVINGGVAGVVVGVLAAVLTTLAGNAGLLSALPLPPSVLALVVGVLPGVASTVAGYASGHTPRPDLDDPPPADQGEKGGGGGGG